MLITLTDPQADAVFAIAEAIAPLEAQTFSRLLTAMNYQNLAEADHVFGMGQANAAEYFVLEGILRSYVLSPEGEDVTLNFFAGPCILSPSIARSVDGISQVSCEALTSAGIVQLHNDELIRLMVADAGIQQWGDAVMRAELVRRMQREIALASKPAKHRLSQFRNDFPELEGSVPHHMIASYIGVTPVTLSRLRNH